MNPWQITGFVRDSLKNVLTHPGGDEESASWVVGGVDPIPIYTILYPQHLRGGNMTPRVG